jgi:hypothetical protein
MLNLLSSIFISIGVGGSSALRLLKAVQVYNALPQTKTDNPSRGPDSLHKANEKDGSASGGAWETILQLLWTKYFVVMLEVLCAVAGIIYGLNLDGRYFSFPGSRAMGLSMRAIIVSASISSTYFILYTFKRMIALPEKNLPANEKLLFSFLFTCNAIFVVSAMLFAMMPTTLWFAVPFAVLYVFLEISGIVMLYKSKTVIMNLLSENSQLDGNIQRMGQFMNRAAITNIVTIIVAFVVSVFGVLSRIYPRSDALFRIIRGFLVGLVGCGFSLKGICILESMRPTKFSASMDQDVETGARDNVTPIA